MLRVVERQIYARLSKNLSDYWVLNFDYRYWYLALFAFVYYFFVITGSNINVGFQ